jgi:TRAP-type mannitol/chloroaromatic compound transport system permease small subunit
LPVFFGACLILIPFCTYTIIFSWPLSVNIFNYTAHFNNFSVSKAAQGFRIQKISLASMLAYLCELL